MGGGGTGLVRRRWRLNAEDRTRRDPKAGEGGPLGFGAQAVLQGIKLSWNTQATKPLTHLQSVPVKLGFQIHRSQRNAWGTYVGGSAPIGEVLHCDVDQEGVVVSCLDEEWLFGSEFYRFVLRITGRASRWPADSFSWVDETVQPGVSYHYTIRPYQEFFSEDGVTAWYGLAENVVGTADEPSQRARVYGRSSVVLHRIAGAGEPGSPANLRATQPLVSGGNTLVRLTWEDAANATSYTVFRSPRLLDMGSNTVAVDVLVPCPASPRNDPNGPYYDSAGEPCTETVETWESPDSTHPGITTTTWEDPDAEAGVHCTYRVAAFNELGRSPDDAKVEIDTVGNNVPNKVRDFQAVPTRTDATSAYVTLSWMAPRDFAIHTGATYLIEYALDIPDKIEWE